MQFFLHSLILILGLFLLEVPHNSTVPADRTLPITLHNNLPRKPPARHLPPDPDRYILGLFFSLDLPQRIRKLQRTANLECVFEGDVWILAVEFEFVFAQGDPGDRDFVVVAAVDRALCGFHDWVQVGDVYAHLNWKRCVR